MWLWQEPRHGTLTAGVVSTDADEFFRRLAQCVQARDLPLCTVVAEFSGHILAAAQPPPLPVTFSPSPTSSPPPTISLPLTSSSSSFNWVLMSNHRSRYVPELQQPLKHVKRTLP